MENFQYTVLADRDSNLPIQGFSETADEVRIGPAKAPVLGMILVFGLLMTIPLLIGISALNKEGAFQWGPLILCGVIFTGATVGVTMQHGRERARGPVFLLDKRTGRYSLPRKSVEGDRSELVETALVECPRDSEGGRPYELQLLIRRGDAAPVAMQLVGHGGESELAKIQKSMTAALKLPAVKVKAAG